MRSADGVVDLELGTPGSVANPKADPETLFAAGYAACFNNALGRIATEHGLGQRRARRSEVGHDVARDLQRCRRRG